MGGSRRTRLGSRLWVALLACVLVAGCDNPTPSAAPGETSGPGQPTDGLEASPGSSSPAATQDVTGEAPSPTAADLIEADVTRGVLDPQVAILYRLYAVFGDPLLPAAYRSGLVTEDNGVFELARRSLETMPQELAEQVRPFIVRPTDPTSVLHEVSKSADGTARLTSWRAGEAIDPERLAAVGPVVCNPDPLSDWGYVLGNDLFKVWGSCATAASQADIQRVTAMVEELWEAISNFLVKVPNPDEGTPVPDEWLDDQGGDGRIDIYLVSPCVYRGGSCRSPGTALASAPTSPEYRDIRGVQTSSSFVLVPQRSLADPLRLRGTLAHELFHVFQAAMNVGGMVDHRGKWHWFEEASAVWAEWHFVPEAASVGVAPWYTVYQRSPWGLASIEGQNAYASYAWPLFLEEQAGAHSIADAWHGIEGRPNWLEVTEAIDDQLTFDRNFRKFAVRNWNKDIGAGAPLDPLHPLAAVGGRLQPGSTRRVPNTHLLPSPPGPLVIDEPVDIKSLYDTYWTFSVDPDVSQIILEFSGVSPVDSFDADALVNVKDKGWEYRRLKKGTTTWCVDNPDDAITEFVVIVSNHDKDPASHVGGSWTVQSPLDPCFSYQIHIDWTDIYGGIPDHFTFDGWADVVQPELSGNGVVTLQGTGTLSGERPGWTACNPGLPGVPSGSGPAIFVASVIGDQVSLSAFPDFASTEFGVNTEPFTMDRKGGTLSIRSEVTTGVLCPRTWFGTMKADLKLKEPLGNEQGP
jgi:hypothetical protein